MVRHVVRMTAASLLIVACMLYPFLPGNHDGLAVTLYAIAQLFGAAGVLLVPLGAIWLAYELRARPTQGETRPGRDIGHRFALASIGASTIVALAAVVIAFVNVGPSLGLGALALWAWCASRLAGMVKDMRTAEVRTFNPAPLYLLVLPVVAALARIALVDRASDFGRNRAIENSARLIADIERHRDVHGQYPRSLLSVWKDYEPSVVGVREYHYEPSGDGYNLYFEHVPTELGTREFVMYNARGEHEMTSHDMDLLLATPAELARGRGYHAVRDASRRHWKRFLFD